MTIGKKQRLEHEMVQGTLDLLILKTVALGPIHGYAIAQRLQQVSRDVVQVPGGSLYPALKRLELKGWIVANGVDSRTGNKHAYVLKPVTGTGECDDREERGDDHSKHHCEDHAQCDDDQSEHHCEDQGRCGEDHSAHHCDKDAHCGEGEY